MIYTVAGLSFAVHATDEQLSHLMPNYTRFAATACGTSFLFEREEKLLFEVSFGVPYMQTCKVEWQTQVHEGMQTTLYMVDNVTMELFATYKEHTLRATIHTARHSLCIHELPDSLYAPLLNVFVQFCYNYFALPKQVCMIHASTVIAYNKAYLFLGKSGTGKSTHAKLWQSEYAHVEALNDDGPILRQAGGVWYACGSPWSGKGRCYKQACYPIGAMVRLQQEKYNQITRYSVAESYIAIMPSLFKWLKDKPLFESQCAWVAQMVQQLPVYLLQCLPNAEAARLCYQTVVHE